MDKFLEIVFLNYTDGEEEVKERYMEIFNPLLERIREQVSEKIYESLVETLIDCANASNIFYAVEGLKLAIGVMNGTYTPTI